MTPEERAHLVLKNHAALYGASSEVWHLRAVIADAIRAAAAEERAAILKLLEDGWRTLGPLQIIEAIRARGEVKP